MKDGKTLASWEHDMRQFSVRLGVFMRNLKVFENKAKELWTEGAWDRNALTPLRNTL